MMSAHLYLSRLPFSVTGYISGLHNVARVVAKRISLVGDDRRHLRVTQLSAESLHGRASNALDADI